MIKNKKGFTLVEVMVVLVIFAILIAIAIPSLMKYIDDANEAKILAQASPVLSASKAEAAKLYAKGRLDTLPNNQTIHKQIIEYAEIDGELISIELNQAKNSSGNFIVRIQDKYIHYDDVKQTFSLIENNPITTSDAINKALQLKEVKDIILAYYTNQRSGSLDSEGPNFGIKIKKELEKLGFDADTYSFRIWSKGNDNTITIGIPKLTLEMAHKGIEVEVTRYDYGSSKDFSSHPKIYSAFVKVSSASAKDANNNNKLVEYPTYILEGANWVEKK